VHRQPEFRRHVQAEVVGAMTTPGRNILAELRVVADQEVQAVHRPVELETQALRQVEVEVEVEIPIAIIAAPA
jgi:hypothetical protein